MTSTILLATKNLHKVKEVRSLLLDLNCEIVSLLDLPRHEQVEETGSCFEENAALKAVTLSREYPYLTLADDSGLAIDRLDGAPGIYSSRFSGDEGDDDANNQKVLQLLKNIPDEDRGAWFVCAVAVAYKGELLKVITDTVEGVIACDLRGETGFGYDPLFIIPSYQKTFAELGPEIKDELSHRGKAFRHAKEFIVSFLQTHQGSL